MKIGSNNQNLKGEIKMKLLVNLAWLIDLALIAIFIVYPSYTLLITDN